MGVKIFVDTGFDRVTTSALLARVKWIDQGLIDGSVTSDEVAHGRPHPDMIFKAMQIAGVREAGKVAKVGDTQSDMLEGTRAGCRWVIGVTSGAYTKTDLEKEPHTHLVEQVPEILHLF
jgi:phosphonatase-like hydrolase